MYEIFEKLLEMHKVTAYRVSKATGIATATLSDWKNGKSTPKQDKLQKIADYFEVPLEYLMTGEYPETGYYLDDETRELAQKIFENPRYKVLFDASRKLKPEDIEFVIDMIDRMKTDD